MKNLILLTALLVVPVLASCGERENPLAKMEPSQLYSWFRDRDKNVVTRINDCAEFWAEKVGTTVSADSRADCVELADFLAAEMTEAGFGKVRGEDVHLATIWTYYHKIRLQNVYDPEEAAKSLRPDWAK